MLLIRRVNTRPNGLALPSKQWVCSCRTRPPKISFGRIEQTFAGRCAPVPLGTSNYTVYCTFEV